MKSLFAVHAYMHVVHVIRCNRGCVPFEINKNFSISKPNPLSDAFFLFFLRIAGKRHTYIVEPSVSDDHKIMLRLCWLVEMVAFENQSKGVSFK